MTVGRVTRHTFFPRLCTCTLGQVNRVSHLKLVQNPVFELTVVMERDAFLGEML